MPLDPLLLERLQGLDLAVDRLLGGEDGGGRTSSRRGSGTEFREHRSYAPGDDLRTIDWNAYGRLEELHVKEHAAEGRLDLALFLDTSPSMNYGCFNKLALARELAACLGFVALRRLDQVTVIALGERKAPPITYRGRSSAFEFIERTLGIESGTGPAQAEEIGRFRDGRRTHGTNFLLTDLLDASSRPDLLRRLSARSQGAVCLHLVDPLEREPELEGRLRLEGIESGDRTVGRIDGEVRAAYRDRFARHLEKAREDCLAVGVRHLLIDTARGTEATIFGPLRSGGVFR